MLTFSVVAALCVVLALAFLVTPLLRRPTSGVSSETANVAVYRDQLAELDADVARGTLSPERHAEARAEIEQRLAEDLASREATRVAESRVGRRLALALAALLPAAAIGIYLGLGNPAALDPAKRLGMSEQEAAERQRLLIEQHDRNRQQAMAELEQIRQEGLRVQQASQAEAERLQNDALQFRQQTQQQCDALVARSRQEASSVVDGANRYAEQVLGELETRLRDLSQVVLGGRRELVRLQNPEASAGAGSASQPERNGSRRARVASKLRQLAS